MVVRPMHVFAVAEELLGELLRTVAPRYEDNCCKGPCAAPPPPAFCCSHQPRSSGLWEASTVGCSDGKNGLLALARRNHVTEGLVRGV
jgi:hypothetical protein